MKKIVIVLLFTGLLAGCGKVNEYSNDFGSSAFINASPGSPAMHIFVDTIQQTASALAYRGNSGYLAVKPGSRKMEIRSSADLKTQFLLINDEVVAGNSAKTYLVYDTQTTASKIVKGVRLSDDLATPAAGTIKFRFLNVAVNSNPVDVTFLRTSVTPNDSVTLTNQAFIGTSPDGASLSAFNRTVPTGAYTIKLKTPGSQTVLASATLGNSPFSSIYTFYCTGTAAGQALSIGIFRHYP